MIVFGTVSDFSYICTMSEDMWTDWPDFAGLYMSGDAILDFWTPLHTPGNNWDRKLKFGMWINTHSSFTTVDNFIRWWAYLCHPVMLKQWEIEDFIIISR